MDFKKATDILFDHVDHARLAQELGVSIATIRQARLDAEAKAHRSPPNEWEDAVIRIAEERADHYQKLVERLRKPLKRK
jgi:hypothetical protein